MATPINNQQVLSSYDKALANLKSAHDQDMENATHFSVLGLHIPKGPFGSSKAQQVESNYQQCVQIEGQIFSNITQMLGILARGPNSQAQGS